MKTLLSFLVLLVLCTFKTRLQAQQILAWYGFDSSDLTPTFVSNDVVTVSNITPNGINVTGYGDGVNNMPDMALYSNQWPIVAVDPSKYYELTITAQPAHSQAKLKVFHSIC